MHGTQRSFGPSGRRIDTDLNLSPRGGSYLFREAIVSTQVVIAKPQEAFRATKLNQLRILVAYVALLFLQSCGVASSQPIEPASHSDGIPLGQSESVVADTAPVEIRDQVALSMGALYQSFEDGVNIWMECRSTATTNWKGQFEYFCPELALPEMALQSELTRLASLFDTYSEFIQPKWIALLAPLFKSVERCFPECRYDWNSVTNLWTIKTVQT
jgi:hypothetical protein